MIYVAPRSFRSYAQKMHIFSYRITSFRSSLQKLPVAMNLQVVEA